MITRSLKYSLAMSFQRGNHWKMDFIDTQKYYTNIYAIVM